MRRRKAWNKPARELHTVPAGELGDRDATPSSIAFQSVHAGPAARVSGYDPETDICWQFRNKGDGYRCKCPAHSAFEAGRKRKLVGFGRGRSGKAWFWTVFEAVQRRPDIAAYAFTTSGNGRRA